MFTSGRKTPSIKGIWNILSFQCRRTKDADFCGGKAELEMVNNKLMLRCSRCGFSVPYPIVEKMVDRFVKEVVEDTANGIETNMTNFKHREYDRSLDIFYYFNVARHTPESIKIEVWK